MKSRAAARHPAARARHASPSDGSSVKCFIAARPSGPVSPARAGRTSARTGKRPRRCGVSQIPGGCPAGNADGQPPATPRPPALPVLRPPLGDADIGPARRSWYAKPRGGSGAALAPPGPADRREPGARASQRPSQSADTAVLRRNPPVVASPSPWRTPLSKDPISQR